MNPTIFSDGNSPKNPLFSLQPFRLIITFLMNKVSLTNGPKRRSTRGKIKWKLFKSSEGSKFIVSGNEWNQVLSFPFFSAVAESGCGGCAARMCALSWDHQCPLMRNDDGSLCLEGHKNRRLNLSWLVRMTIYGPSPREKKSHSRLARTLWSLSSDRLSMKSTEFALTNFTSPASPFLPPYLSYSSFLHELPATSSRHKWMV